MAHELWLGIVHAQQMRAPTAAEVMQSPLYQTEFKDALSKCRKKGDVAREVRKIINKHRKPVMVEQVFLTDSSPKQHLQNATLIINVDSRTIVKNRLDNEDTDRLIDLYIKRYADKIAEFRKKFGNNI